MNTHRRWIIGGAALACAMAAPGLTRGALADNVLVNPGFETGDFTGWDVFSCCPPDGSLFFVSGNNPHTGTFDAEFDGPVSRIDPHDYSIEQTFAPIPTESITEVSFWGYDLIDDSGFGFSGQFRVHYTDGSFDAMNVNGPPDVWTKLDFTSILDPGKQLNRIQLLGGGPPDFAFHELLDDFLVDVIPPFGACCVNGTCLDLMTGGNCAAVGGSYLGNDTACAEGPGSCFNDDCDGAITILAGDTAYSNVGATTDGPDLPPGCEEGSGLSFVKDVWFRYVPTASGTLTVSTCNQVDYDSRLAAYTGDCGALDLIACNDDGPGCAGFSSLMTLQVTCGQEILLRVGAFGGLTPEGGGTLTLALAACLADLNGDGQVSFADLLLLLGEWGVCPTP